MVLRTLRNVTRRVRHTTDAANQFTDRAYRALVRKTPQLGKRYFRQSGLFDEGYYREQYGDVPANQDALEHYWQVGLHEQRRPNAFFDPAWYFETYPDAEQSGMNALTHYMLYGSRERRFPGPNFDPTAYLRHYPEVIQTRMDPLQHYLTKGVHEGKQTFPTHREHKVIDDGTIKLVMRYAPTPLMPTTLDFDPARMVIHWIIPDYSPGSGGHLGIFKLVSHLEQYGHVQTVWIFNHGQHQDIPSAVKDARGFAPIHNVDFRFLKYPEQLAEVEGDAIIATHFSTVWPVLSARYFKRRFYYVQDHEPDFYARGAHYLMAQDTYRQDMDFISLSPWPGDKVKETAPDAWTTHLYSAPNREVYKRRPAPPNNPVKRIALYARFFTARRAVELAVYGLVELTKRGVPFHVDFFGMDNPPIRNAPFSFTNHGLLTEKELAALYYEVDMGLVFSATNYSLVPQEMMTCGLPVLEVDNDSTRRVYPDDVIRFARPNVQDIAEAAAELLTNDDLRAELSERGHEWSKQFTFEKSARHMETSLRERIALHIQKNDYTPPKPRPTASVVIPTYNGGEIWKRVLAAVLEQDTPWPYEVIVIDSGSTDGTVELVRETDDERLRLIEIDKSEFQHGLTRNRGIYAADGLYVALITQDALPADAGWLQRLVAPLEESPTVAGVTGRHLPHADADPFTQRDLNGWFEMLNGYHTHLHKWSDLDRYDAQDLAWMRILRFFSDNNACIRKSVWEVHPYPSTTYGEDQMWAQAIIDAGYVKVYAHDAAVHHSHNFDEAETYERAWIEASFFREAFGDIRLRSQAQLREELAAQNEADRQYAAALNLDNATLERRLVLNAARLRGTYDGSMGLPKQDYAAVRR